MFKNIEEYERLMSPGDVDFFKKLVSWKSLSSADKERFLKILWRLMSIGASDKVVVI